MSVPETAEGSVLRACPSALPIDITTLSPPGGLVIISPHPDDETLGCGQALSAAARIGREILLVLLTDGEAFAPGRKEHERNRLAARRLDELSSALAILAPGKRIRIERARLPDGQSEPGRLSPERFEELFNAARGIKAAAIWATWRGDPHCDHQTASMIGRRFAERLDVPMWSYPVWGRFGERSHPAAPLLFSDRRAAQRKRSAIQCYRSQLHQWPGRRPGDFTLPPELVEHFASHPEIFFGER
ncbi:MAG: PIG-L family deacetylase [Erythrobacter sp.]|nr:PIG-L family deacetylase [Erythrobacter sp.]